IANKGLSKGVYTWEEVQSHCSRNDQWLVIDRKVYNITQWAKRHPGGFRVIGHYAGEDATVRFHYTDLCFFSSRPLFFFLHLSHIILLEALAWLIVSMWGTGWILTLLCSVLLATAQVIET
uniref:Cytochrome b5 heme-binding domain-containing protein n=1 Tax=Haplochromis burtoni TaxID=8153 RepID=A0A3Q2VXX6_HAPBU